ncbi:hypothetical protein SAMN05443245_7041 [Paraburkholderia fungorum]|uniref:Uncharacterized protein n=1 Tax=Paraburkholderia fungorum TaxID=134537 RepID=A0A1H1JPA2_9BURK|nr:hypothetical protein SAMN05443245_7041 [Paraburkholderia fungorum]
MNRRATTGSDEHAALLLRMAQSRDALREANAIALIPRRQRNSVMTSATGAAIALANAPHVTFLLALCVGALTFGPSRALRIILRAGVSGWVASSAKRVARR